MAATLFQLTNSVHATCTKSLCFRAWKEKKMLSDLIYTKESRSDNIFT